MPTDRSIKTDVPLTFIASNVVETIFHLIVSTSKIYFYNWKPLKSHLRI